MTQKRLRIGIGIKKAKRKLMDKLHQLENLVAFVIQKKSRFSENNRLPVSFILSLIPEIAIDKEPLAANFLIYQDDVPSFSALTSEIHQWTFYWRHKVASGEVTIPENLIKSFHTLIRMYFQMQGYLLILDVFFQSPVPKQNGRFQCLR